tara:strand:+ start:71 stop:883 length:813 start_codon:yes stop_codon:yes gene_type:complete
MDDKQLIFVLDLDNTIIGNCTYQSDIYILHKFQMKYGIKTINNNLQESYKYNSKLIRPYFYYFYKKIKEKYPNSYIFIYTASENNWAKKEIGLIEKGLNIKFSRPIFTRNDCIINSNGEYKKLISKILPKIKKITNNIKENLVIIDNNNTFVDYNSNFILCKSYEYIYFLDIWKNINKDFYKYTELTNYIVKLIKNNKLSKYYNMETISSKELEKIYKWKYKKYKKINKINKKYLNDKFWKILTDNIISNNFYKFNKDTVAYLQKITDNK